MNILKQIQEKRTASRVALGVGLSLCLGGVMGMPSVTEAASAEAAASATTELSRMNAAQRELLEQERQIASRQKAVAEVAGVKSKYVKVPVSSLVVKSYPGMTEDQLLRVVPEAKKHVVDIHQLSKEIQFINDAGAMKINANFSRDGAAGYLLTLTAEKVQEMHTTVTVSNTGNDYTGNWRVATSYTDRNLSRAADTLGVAYVTSPSAGHLSDVKQGALAYRLPLGHDADALTFSASYSDVDLGSVDHEVTPFGPFDATASGKGFTAGLHYQHHMAYTSREKDGMDFGVNYWNMKNSYGYLLNNKPLDAPETRYDVSTVALSFFHNDRDAAHSLSYQAGVETNLGNVGGDYRDPGYKYNRNFQIYHASASYNYRTPSDWIFAVRGEGQYSNNNLVPALQVGAGGRTSVRGFTERAIAADKGVTGSLEIYTPKFATGSRFLVFLDAAKLSNNERAGTLFDDKGIASWGVGYRYMEPTGRATLSIDYADPIKDVPDSWQQQHKRWNMQMSINF